MNKPLILVVEDDTPVRNLITTTLKAHDYRFLTAANGESAILEASSHNPEIILLDCQIWMAWKSFTKFVPGPICPLL